MFALSLNFIILYLKSYLFINSNYPFNELHLTFDK